MPGISSDKPHRPIRSFVLRAGRLTPAQTRALEEIYPVLGIQPGKESLDFAGLFGRQAEVIIEIGFGNGDATWNMAISEPEKDFVGIEVHPPGVGRLLQILKEKGIGNVRVAMEDATELIAGRVGDNSLAGVRIYFPDPWPKKRHHKRRLIQPHFIALLAAKMKPGAILHLATDWVPYAEHMLEVLQACDDFSNLSESGSYSEKPLWRPATKYERRGDRLGHETRDLLFRKKA
jgi:tRNA (guanine-N7-)-methyltransferase